MVFGDTPENFIGLLPSVKLSSFVMTVVALEAVGDGSLLLNKLMLLLSCVLNDDVITGCMDTALRALLLLEEAQTPTLTCKYIICKYIICYRFWIKIGGENLVNGTDYAYFLSPICIDTLK